MNRRRLLDSPWLYFGLAGVLLVVAVLSQVRIRVSSRRPGTLEQALALRGRDDVNLVFILIDTLRRDHLHCYGYARPTSPVMDALAKTGIRFAHVISQSTWTKASMASMVTATYPHRNGVLRWEDAIPEAARLPAEVLHDAGFRTVGLYRNGWVGANFGFGQGFDIYLKPKPGAAAMQRRSPGTQRLAGSDYDVTQAAEAFLQNVGNQRFFLYLHYMDVHQYTSDTKAPDFGTGYVDAYDSAVAWVDRNVGFVVNALDEQGLLGRTWVVIASDHGEEFLEHGNEGHAKSLYREVVEVPLILVPPVRLRHPVVVEDAVENVDIWPTLLDLLGLPPLPQADGRSLVPAILRAAGEKKADAPPSDGQETARFSELDRHWGQPKAKSLPMQAVTRGPLRLIVTRPPSGKERVELYDHRMDTLEAENLAEERLEQVAALKQQLEAYRSRPLASWGKPTEVELDELELGQLRALGYVVK